MRKHILNETLHIICSDFFLLQKSWRCEYITYSNHHQILQLALLKSLAAEETGASASHSLTSSAATQARTADFQLRGVDPPHDFIVSLIPAQFFI